MFNTPISQESTEPFGSASVWTNLQLIFERLHLHCKNNSCIYHKQHAFKLKALCAQPVEAKWKHCLFILRCFLCAVHRMSHMLALLKRYIIGGQRMQCLIQTCGYISKAGLMNFQNFILPCLRSFHCSTACAQCCAAKAKYLNKVESSNKTTFSVLCSPLVRHHFFHWGPRCVKDFHCAPPGSADTERLCHASRRGPASEQIQIK